MAFIDDWRQHVHAALPEVAALVSSPSDIHLGLLATGVLWPIRTAIQANDQPALNAIHDLLGARTEQVAHIVATWGSDLLSAARALDRHAQATPELAAALGQLVGAFAIASDLAALIVARTIPTSGPTNFLGDIQAALLNVGGLVNIANLTITLPLPPPAADPLATAEALLATLPLNEIPDPAPLPSGSRMPLRPNPFFTGRADELKTLAAALLGLPSPAAGGGGGGEGRPPAIALTTGIGGVGKTQLAAEVAHRYGRFFAGGVFWLSFADPAGVETEIAACGGAGALELYTDAAGLSLAEQVACVQQAWAAPIPRLLIFDNCDDTASATAEQLLAAHLPTAGGCRVLVTSRRGHWLAGLGLTPYPLGTLPRDESITLLRRHRPDLSASADDAIAAELGDLPLALSLAGSYLETYQDEPFGQPAAYLASIQKQLLAHRSLQGAGAAPSLTKHEQNVRATVALSYDRLDPANPVDALAIAALARAAHLAPGEPFPRDLLLAMLGDATDDEDIAAQRADALRRLIALGLLEVAEDGALRVHRLISAFTKAAITGEEAQGAVEQILTNVGNNLVNEGFPTHLLPFIAHLRHVMTIADRRGDAPAASLANALGRAEEALTNYAAARPLYERALSLREQALGPSHPDTASSLNNLAGLLEAQGDYAAARPLYERALQITEQALGPSHPSTASSLNNLAGLLEAQGDYAAARPLYERALSLREQALGPSHPSTASSLNNLAGLLEAQGDYAAARPLYERALQITEQALGPSHPSTASSLNNLAGLLRAQGDYAAARPLYERALQITEQALGPSHPSTATSLNNLAGLLMRLGDLATAQEYHERALALREQVLGPTHPHTAQSLWWLGTVRANMGDRDGARARLQRAVTIYMHTLGPTHPTTQQCQRQLAALDTPPQTRAQRIAEITVQAESAVAAALADPTIDRATLAQQLEAVAQQAEDGETEGSPYLALAAHLRNLAAQLDAPPTQSS